MDGRADDRPAWDGRPGVDTYVGWDGSRYTGPPPDGWYLASDHRWWPTSDIIEADGDELFDQSNDPIDAPIDDPIDSQAPFLEPVPEPQQEPDNLSDWAPSSAPPAAESAQPARPTTSPPPPIGASGRTATGRGRRRSASGRSATRAGASFFFLAIAFARCAFDSDTFEEPNPAPSDFTLPTTTQVGGLLVEGLDYSIEGIDCAAAGETITVFVTNLGRTIQSYEITVEIQLEGSGGETTTISRMVETAPALPDGVAAGTIFVDTAETPTACEVTQVRPGP